MFVVASSVCSDRLLYGPPCSVLVLFYPGIQIASVTANIQPFIQFSSLTPYFVHKLLLSIHLTLYIASWLAACPVIASMGPRLGDCPYSLALYFEASLNCNSLITNVLHSPFQFRGTRLTRSCSSELYVTASRVLDLN